MPRDPADCYTPEPTILEQRAASLLARYRDRSAGSDDPDEIARRLHRATRRAVGLALGAGIISGGLIGGSEIWLRRRFGLDQMDIWEALPYWAGWFAAAGVVSAVEIAFLYWIALRGMGEVARLAPVALGESGYGGLAQRGFARGALEFPNPRRDIFGIDPYAYVPNWQLVLRSIAYKMKVGVSSFILRVFLRRVATRLAVRGLVPLLAGPLYAAWNAYISWKIMREARLRAFGPGAIDAFIEKDLGSAGLSEDAGAAMLHGVGEITRRAGDMHPNYVHLVARLCERLGIGSGPIGIDWPSGREHLRHLGPQDRDRVLQLLLLAAILGTRTGRRQRDLVEEAFRLGGTALPEEAIPDLRRRLRDGRLEPARDLRRWTRCDAGRG
jgi:hypothetical protein